jgi:hypothetical protein
MGVSSQGCSRGRNGTAAIVALGNLDVIGQPQSWEQTQDQRRRQPCRNFVAAIIRWAFIWPCHDLLFFLGTNQYVYVLLDEVMKTNAFWRHVPT